MPRTLTRFLVLTLSLVRHPSFVSGLATLLLALGAGVRASDGQTAPIPQQALWESQMVEYGQRHCEALVAAGLLDTALGRTFYDATRVFYQIGDYTGQPWWQMCAQAAGDIYRDGYVMINVGESGYPGAVAGHWNFTTGLRIDFERTGNLVSRAAVVGLSNAAAFANDATPQAWTASIESSREVAYAILSYIDAESLGAPPRPRRIDLVDQAYDHMAQWFVRFEWAGTTQQMAPFMVGLTAHALIRDWEQTQDPRLIPALRLATDWLWANAWDSASQSMLYQVNPDATVYLVDGQQVPAPDLNLLIALYRTRFLGHRARRRGDHRRARVVW